MKGEKQEDRLSLISDKIPDDVENVPSPLERCNKKRIKGFGILIFVGLVVASLVLLGLSFAFRMWLSSSQKTMEVCETEACLDIKNWMDLNANPCENFYQVRGKLRLIK